MTLLGLGPYELHKTVMLKNLSFRGPCSFTAEERFLQSSQGSGLTRLEPRRADKGPSDSIYVFGVVLKVRVPET